MKFPFPKLLYSLAYGLSLARLPVAALPYLCKMGLFFASRGWLQKYWDADIIQLLRITGDFCNAALFGLLVNLTPNEPGISTLKGLLAFSLIAEIIRLLTEKGMMLLSAGWQVLPHRWLAARLEQSPLAGRFHRYCRYYTQPEEARLAQALEHLQQFSASHPASAMALSYVHGFRVVPKSVGLRCGLVRNVAQGWVYIHPGWSNHPGLLYGLALRRSAWIFDPRHLARPFCYRTQANRLMTLQVFEHAALCPFYAVYQFGHEIKSARYDAFFRALRWLGLPGESPVLADGSYRFEPLAHALGLIQPSGELPHSLWNDDEVIQALAGQPIPDPLTIAEQFTYPLIYVTDVLLPKIKEQTSLATAKGASQ